MTSSPPESERLAEQLLGDGMFAQRYPALTQALQFAVGSQINVDTEPAATPENLNEVASAPPLASSLPAGLSSVAPTPSPSNPPTEPFPSTPSPSSGARSRLVPEPEHGAGLPHQFTESAERIGTPLPGMSPERTPLYFAQQLAEIESKYADVIQRRHTVKYFHDTLKETAAGKRISELPGPEMLFRSRLQRISDINRPTASLASTIPIPWGLSGGKKANEFFEYPGGGLNLSNVLAPPDKEKPLISRELILEGIQKMPKPNPAWMFHKEAYDMSALHLTEQAIGMRHRSAEVDRQIQQLLQDAENQGLTAAGAHPILKDLLQTQRDLLRDQQRIKEELVEQGLAMASENDRVTRHVRDDFYSQLFAQIENPEQLRYYRDRAKNVASALPRRDAILRAKAAEDAARAVASSRFGLLPEHKDKMTGNASPLEIKRLIERAQYSERRVPVDGCPTVTTQFPGIFPRSAYGNALPARCFSLKTKRKWEELGAPSFETVSTVRDQWVQKLEKEKAESPAAQHARREAWAMKKQLELRAEGEEWVEYLHRNNEAMERRARTRPPFVVKEAELGRVVAEVERKPEKWLPTETEKKEPLIALAALGATSMGSSAVVESNAVDISSSEADLETKSISPELPSFSAPIVLPSSVLEPEKKVERPSIQIIVSKPAERRRTVIAKSTMAQRLPRRQCQEYVELDHWGQVQPVNQLHDELKRAVAQKRLGLPATAQILYDLARCCQDPDVSGSGYAKEISNILCEGLPYYPLQLDLLEAGLIALLKIYEAHTNQLALTESYVQCFTTLLAVDELAFRTQLIAALALVMQHGKLFLQTDSISTDLVDLLLVFIGRFDDPVITAQGLTILGVACMGHRKADQYTLCIGCLDFWRHEPSVLVYACLAVDAFARRADMEATRVRMRSPRQSPKRLMSRKILTSQEDQSGKLKMTGLLHATLEVNSKPVSWMPQDGSDVTSIVTVMKMHSSHRKVLGAACTAISSLVKVSDLHARAVLKHAWEPLFTAARELADSTSIATSAATIVEQLVLIESTQPSVANEKSIRAVARILSDHAASPEVVAACCTAFVAMGPVLSSCIDVFDDNFLRGIITTATKNVSNSELCSAVSCFIALLAPSKQLVDMQQHLTSVGSLEFCHEALRECLSDAKTCETVCRALSRLVYKNSEAEAKLGSLPVVATLTFVLMRHSGDPDSSQVALNALKCSLAAGAATVKSLEPGQLEVIEHVWDVAENSNSTKVVDEVGYLLKELAKKVEEMPKPTREIYNRLVARRSPKKPSSKIGPKKQH